MSLGVLLGTGLKERIPHNIFSKIAFRYLERFALNGAVLFTTSSFKVCEFQDFAFASLAKVARISTLHWVFLISKI